MGPSTSPSVTEDQQNHDEDNYSEWRVVFSDGNITKNEGFRVRDFQSSKGGPSVIDPEHFRAIHGDLTPGSSRRKKQDLIEKIETRIPFFLEAYNIELSVDRFDTGYTDDFGNPYYSDGFYLRRPRIVTDQEATEGRDHEVVEIQDSAPIFLWPFIPGDLDIDMKYDATAMKFDEATWKLLQSTHPKSIMTSDCCYCLHCILYVAWMCAIAFACRWNLLAGVLVFLAFLVFQECVTFFGPSSPRRRHLRERRRHLRECKEKARLVTERLRQDEDKADWIVEFHSSVLPGREPLDWPDRDNLSDRYVFSRTTTRSLPTATDDESNKDSGA